MALKKFARSALVHPVLVSSNRPQPD